MSKRKKKNLAGAEDKGFIPTDWKTHSAKTLITLALTGLGTLMYISGSFLVDTPKRLEKFSTMRAMADEERAKATRQGEFTKVLTQAQQRVANRFNRFNEYLESHRDHILFAKLSEIVNESSQESATDSGLMSGYTPDTTGLSISLHESVNGYFRTERDFWNSLDELLGPAQKNHKAQAEKIAQVRSRLQNMFYATSLFNSSVQDATSMIQTHAQKLTDISETMKGELEFETTMIRAAWESFLLSTLVFILVACILVLERIEKKMAADKKILVT